MRLYQCPACDCLPLRYKKPPTTTPKCIRCGRTLVKISRIPKTLHWGMIASTAVSAALFAPHLVEHWTNRYLTTPSPPGLSGSIAPQPAIERETSSLDRIDLFTKLEEADSTWQPQEELLPDGSRQYRYKKRPGEPDLNLAELRALINEPPTFDIERKVINSLLETLQSAGVRVMLAPTLKQGAAAEWDHHHGTMRIKPEVIDSGSKDFLRVLNHESIHVAQSCRAGSLYSKPKPLGLNISTIPEFEAPLASSIYADIPHEDKVLEKEAYSLQNDTFNALKLLSKECTRISLILSNQG
jgi:hypothetical protein